MTSRLWNMIQVADSKLSVAKSAGLSDLKRSLSKQFGTALRHIWKRAHLIHKGQKMREEIQRESTKTTRTASSAIPPCQDGKGQQAKFTWSKTPKSMRLAKAQLSKWATPVGEIPVEEASGMTQWQLKCEEQHTSQYLCSDGSYHVTTRSSPTCVIYTGRGGAVDVL